MFFLSGIFVWPSLNRKGSCAFLRGRLLRIGLPFLLGVYLLMSFAYYPAYRVGTSDPSWLGYWQHLEALPFWPSGPLWFLWELLLFDIAAAALHRFFPAAGDALGRLSRNANSTPGRYFCGLSGISALAYLPLALMFGAKEWREFGPFALQPDRILLYFVYFLAGLGVGAHGYDRGLLHPDGTLVRRWPYWLAAAPAAFVLWMACVAPSVYNRSNIAIDLAGYLAVVLAVASACLCFVAMFLRFATGRRPWWDSIAENAYVIYLVHYVFVVWLQYGFLGAALPAVVKAILVFVFAFALSWATAISIAAVAAYLRTVRFKPSWETSD